MTNTQDCIVQQTSLHNQDLTAGLIHAVISPQVGTKDINFSLEPPPPAPENAYK